MTYKVVVFFDIDAHEYQGRWFNNIRAWKVDRVQSGAPAPQAPIQPPFPVIIPQNRRNDTERGAFLRFRNSNINFDDAVFVTDKAKDGMPYWKGDLQATYENNILKINGTLTETK